MRATYDLGEVDISVGGMQAPGSGRRTMGARCRFVFAINPPVAELRGKERCGRFYMSLTTIGTGGVDI